ncbi:UDP-N-acetylmuramate dehydrogenase [Patescibacteria group bacterium]|nr:UDP-N-acetylmuramate dehydrogenase [Patescibacteria group bacterium]
MNNPFSELKKEFGDTVGRDVPLAPYTTFKIGGPAEYFIEIRSAEELARAVCLGRSLSLSVTVLGGGSNILIGDRGMKGLVIRNLTSSVSIRGATGVIQKGKKQSGKVYVEADSGLGMNQLVRTTIEEGLGGLEMHLGLPGTVGGAVFMNSKWTHPEGAVGDAVYQATILNGDNEVQTVPRAYFRFSYDTSHMQKTADIVLRVVFALTPGDKELLWKTANESIGYRRKTQPQGVSSPGCTFRNLTVSEAISIPTPNHTTSAGFLIDHAGLKGYRVGDAQVSPVHANFIINLGHAKASDVVQLIEEMRRRVHDQYGVTLEEEIRRMGDF